MQCANKTPGSCLSGHAILATPSGFIRISDIAGNASEDIKPIPYELITADGSTNSGYFLHCMGIHSVYSVILENGMEVCGTYDHGLLSKYGNETAFVTIEALSPGNYIMIPSFQIKGSIDKGAPSSFIKDIDKSSDFLQISDKNLSNFISFMICSKIENNTEPATTLSINKENDVEIRTTLFKGARDAAKVVQLLLWAHFGIEGTVDKDGTLIWSGEDVAMLDTISGILSTDSIACKDSLDSEQIKMLLPYRRNIVAENDRFCKIADIQGIGRIPVYGISCASNIAFIANGMVNECLQ